MVLAVEKISATVLQDLSPGFIYNPVACRSTIVSTTTPVAASAARPAGAPLRTPGGFPLQTRFGRETDRGLGQNDKVGACSAGAATASEGRDRPVRDGKAFSAFSLTQKFCPSAGAGASPRSSWCRRGAFLVASDDMAEVVLLDPVAHLPQGQTDLAGGPLLDPVVAGQGGQ